MKAAETHPITITQVEAFLKGLSKDDLLALLVRLDLDKEFLEDLEDITKENQALENPESSISWEEMKTKVQGEG